MSDKKPTKRAARKPKATTTAAAEPPRDNTRERTDLLAKLLQEQGIQRVVLRITNAWSDTLLEDEDARLEYIRSAYEELVAEFTPRIAVDALEARYGIEAVKKTLGDHAKGAVERWKKAIAEQPRTAEERYQDARIIDQEAAQNIIIARNQTSGNRVLERSETIPRAVPTITTRIASRAAFHIVDAELKRGGTILEVSRRLQLLEGGKPDAFTQGTSPIHLPMNHVLLKREDATREITIGRNNSELRIRTEIDYEQVLGANFQNRFSEEDLQQFQTNLIQRKGIGLFKVHLDLQSEAYRAGGDGKFPYDFKDALERQGYTKNHDRRGYHDESMRQIRQNIHVLGMLKVTVYEGRSRTGKTVVGRTPYWISTLELSEDDNIQNLLGDKSSNYSTATIMLPGEWWAFAKMNQYRMEIPQSILELPVDEHKNRTNRYALLLASYLAIHVRRNQEEHAGKKVPLSVGVMLEQAGIITRDEFMLLEPNQAKRERDYLETIDGRGALSILARHQANSVDIREEEAFFATGKGWKERFWNAMLSVDVPNLGIAKRPRRLRRAIANGLKLYSQR
jgi:hypothetical protein